MLTFEQAISLFNDDKIRDLAQTADGLRFLKLRSLSRKEHMNCLIEKEHLNIGDSKSKDWLKILYESAISENVIDEVIKKLYAAERSEREKCEDALVNELYKVESFEWGGLYQNSLEKTIVDNYIKKIRSYDSLSEVIEKELLKSMRAYVLASWYNHWSSIIIEDIFKDHEKTLPAVGLIKKVDFFIDGKPFDLKVTYIPEGYIKDYRKSKKLTPELTLLKKMAKTLEITFNKDAPESFLIPDLWKKLGDHPDNRATDLINELQEHRQKLLSDSVANPKCLVRWLYENQGIRRFDASNRLFLVLVDKNSFFDSWKLKRAKPLIKKEVNAYLDRKDRNFGFELDFEWEGKTLKTESDVIFVIKK